MRSASVPWHRAGPGVGRPTNASTGLKYRGVNVVALWAEATTAGYGSGHWASFRQWQKVGDDAYAFEELVPSSVRRSCAATSALPTTPDPTTPPTSATGLTY